MTRGRRPDGRRMAAKLPITDPTQRERLETILATLSGDCRLADAAQRLGLSEEGFRRLRWKALQGMADGIEPRPPGPPPPSETESALRADRDRLETENRRLQVELECQRLREEISVVMPHLLQPRAGDEKNGRRRRSRSPRRR